MSQNIEQLFIANPATSLQATDLFYLGRAPYSPTNDMAVQFSTILAAIPSGNWVDVATGAQALAVETGYVTDNGASLVTYTLPATAAFGSIIEVSGKSSGGWTIAQNAGQTIHLGNQTTTTGVAGSLSSTNQWDYVKLLCVTANTTFNIIGGVGNITVV